MPLELGVWRIDDKCRRVETTSLSDEARLEDLLDADISIASPNWMIIGRQVLTDYGTFIDLLAIDRDGNLVVIELKRDKTPRDVVSQVIDYASWIMRLDADDIGRIYSQYIGKYHSDRAKQSVDEAFCANFQVKEMPETLNEQHELVVVASALDESTERIVKYLSDQHSVPVNALFFRVFRDGEREYLVRAWFIEPTDVGAISPTPSTTDDWNGEYYFNFGHGERRNWDDACKYNFVSAGGGGFYSKTLHALEPGNRIWVNLPGYGYAGVGRVKERAVRIDKCELPQKDGTRAPIASLPLSTPEIFNDKDNQENAEFVVAVDWIHTVPVNQAVKERGFFGNQNTVCQPTAKKWDYTIQRLKEKFGVQD